MSFPTTRLRRLRRSELLRSFVQAPRLFGIPEPKDERGSSAYGDDCIVAQAVRAIRQAVGEKLLILCDVCLCEYTSHGHCGVLKGRDVENDATLDLLADASLSYGA